MLDEEPLIPTDVLDSIPLAPESDAAEQASFVGDDLHIFARLEVELLGVASAEIEVIPVEEFCGLFDGILYQLVPMLSAVFVETAAAKEVLVGFALAPGMVGELEAGAETATGEERRAESSTQRESQFHAVADDGAVALNGRIVGHADGPFPALLKFKLQWIAHPCGMQVRRGVGGAALDDAGKTDRNAIEGGELFAEFFKAGEHEGRRGNGGRVDALALANRLARRVEQHGLEAGAADVDRERDGRLFVGRCAGRWRSGFDGFDGHSNELY